MGRHTRTQGVLTARVSLATASHLVTREWATSDVMAGTSAVGADEGQVHLVVCCAGGDAAVC